MRDHVHDSTPRQKFLFERDKWYELAFSIGIMFSCQELSLQQQFPPFITNI